MTSAVQQVASPFYPLVGHYAATLRSIDQTVIPVHVDVFRACWTSIEGCNATPPGVCVPFFHGFERWWLIPSKYENLGGKNGAILINVIERCFFVSLVFIIFLDISFLFERRISAFPNGFIRFAERGRVLYYSWINLTITVRRIGRGQFPAAKLIESTLTGIRANGR